MSPILETFPIHTAPTSQWQDKTTAVAIPYTLYPVEQDGFWGWSDQPPADGAIALDWLIGFHAVNELETIGREAIQLGNYVVILPPDPANPTLFKYVPGYSTYYVQLDRNLAAFQNTITGTIESIAIDKARDSHYLGGLRHLLYEPVRTNRILRSQELDNASWTKRGTTITANAGVAPDGTTTADQTTLGALGVKDLYQVVSGYGASAALTTSFYCKVITAGTGTLRVVNATTGLNPVSFTPLTIWQKFTAPDLANAGGAAGVVFYSSDGSDWTVQIWGVQQEEGSYATSYIPTTTSAVIRPADTLTDWGVTWTSQVVTQYERYLDLTTNAYVDGITTFTDLDPNPPTAGRAYTHILTAMGTKTLEEMRILADIVVDEDYPLIFSYVPGNLFSATFSRGYAALQTTAAGTVQAVAIDAPRDSHYVAGVRHLLLEGARTNLHLRSAEFDHAYWTKDTNVSVTANNTTAPDGTMTADRVTWTSALNDKGLYAPPVAVSPTLVNSKSVYVRADVAGGTFGISDSNDAIGETTYVLTTSWQRCVQNVGIHASGFSGLWIRRKADSPNVIYVWGAQLENAVFATSLIPTTTATVTRPYDLFTSWTTTWSIRQYTQYERYLNLATNTYVDGVTYHVGTTPQPLTNDRAYTHIYCAESIQSLATMRTLAGT